VHIYFATQRALPRHRADATLLTPAEGGPEVREREDLCAVLVVAARLPSLDADVNAMGLTWENLGDGYLRVHDGLFTLYVVELDIAGPAEGDDLLHSFGHGTLRSPGSIPTEVPFAATRQKRLATLTGSAARPNAARSDAFGSRAIVRS